ncbi:hypothetical protein SAMN06295912_12039 [Sphingomonas laterariae]|uniref:Uncharacterized protein n=1 Tax=Edaphosphingomonas laterariae TaxID=861865 RepID=A0A239I0W8_9SPHN|nr:hypothetical protein SAMN06295912_12039 [Sphingomonas laterariae]
MQQNIDYHPPKRAGAPSSALTLHAERPRMKRRNSAHLSRAELHRIVAEIIG